LVAAYDDARGVTAAFNRKRPAEINWELGADFDLAAFEHVARWDAEREWIEMRLRSVRAQVVRLPALHTEVRFAAGEQLRTEISTKFRRERVEDELAAAGAARAVVDRSGRGLRAVAVRPGLSTPDRCTRGDRVDRAAWGARRPDD